MSLTWLQEIRKHTILVIAIAIHLLSVGGLVYANQRPDTASVPVAIPADSAFPTPTISGLPTEITIPSVGINLKVEPGSYDRATDSWTLSGYNAHFANITRPANNGGGNTFIYGHNNKHVFGPIKSATPGAEAVVTTDNGNKFYYTLKESKVVPPSDVSIFTYTGAPILTVQTCTGVWHEQRQLYTFRLERVEESERSLAVRTEAQRLQLLQAVATVLNPTFQLDSQAPQQAPSSDVTVISPQFTELQTVSTPSSSNPSGFASLISMEQPLFRQLR